MKNISACKPWWQAFLQEVITFFHFVFTTYLPGRKLFVLCCTFFKRFDLFLRKWCAIPLQFSFELQPHLCLLWILPVWAYRVCVFPSPIRLLAPICNTKKKDNQYKRAMTVSRQKYHLKLNNDYLQSLDMKYLRNIFFCHSGLCVSHILILFYM